MKDKVNEKRYVITIVKHVNCYILQNTLNYAFIMRQYIFFSDLTPKIEMIEMIKMIKRTLDFKLG